MAFLKTFKIPLADTACAVQGTGANFFTGDNAAAQGAPSVIVGNMGSGQVYVAAILLRNVEIDQGATVGPVELRCIHKPFMGGTFESAELAAFKTANVPTLTSAIFTVPTTNNTAQAGEQTGGYNFRYFQAAGVIQEIVNQPGWVKGNSICLYLGSPFMAEGTIQTVESIEVDLTLNEVLAPQKISELYQVTDVVSSDLTLIEQGGEAKKIPVGSIYQTYDLGTEYAAPPTAPAAGLQMYAQKKGRVRPAWIDSSGRSASMQSFLGSNKVAWWTAGGNSTTAFGQAVPGMFSMNMGYVTTGTVSARNVASNNVFTRARRVGYLAASSARALVKTNLPQYSRRRGFDYSIRFGIHTVGSGTNRAIEVGMMGDPALTSYANLGYTNQFYLRFDTTANVVDTFSSNDVGVYAQNNAAITGFDNTRFPSNTANVDLYDLRFFCPPDGEITVYLENLTTGANHTYQIPSAAQPAIDGLMFPMIASRFGAPAGYGFDLVSMYVETDT